MGRIFLILCKNGANRTDQNSKRIRVETVWLLPGAATSCQVCEVLFQEEAKQLLARKRRKGTHVQDMVCSHFKESWEALKFDDGYSWVLERAETSM